MSSSDESLVILACQKRVINTSGGQKPLAIWVQRLGSNSDDVSIGRSSNNRPYALPRNVISIKNPEWFSNNGCGNLLHRNQPLSRPDAGRLPNIASELVSELRRRECAQTEYLTRQQMESVLAASPCSLP